MKRLPLLSTLFFVYACTFVDEGIKIQPASNPTSPSYTEVPPITVTLSSLPTPQKIYGQVGLFCETYIKTTWGNGPGQWGWPDGLEYRPSTLLPIEFDGAGRLYFADYVNLRLLRYDEPNSLPLAISLQSLEVPWLFPFPFQFSIDIHQDEILVPYGVDKLGILSVDTGDLVNSVRLPGYHYDPYYPTSNVIRVDEKGRLYLWGKPEEYYAAIQNVFFDPGWRDGKWKKTEMSEDMTHIVNPYFWKSYIISEVYVTDTIVMLISSLDNQSSASIDTKLPKRWTPALFGVDDNGDAYLIVVRTPPTWTYARYSLLTGEIQMGQVRLETDYTVAIPSVSPEGTLYILAYSDEDLSVPPRIVKCQFPDR